MAEKRMFSNRIVGSDAFIDMPDSTQNLYFHLSLSADDDGFVDKPKTIMRMTGKKDDDLKLLIAKSFIIPFENGVVVIKHWRINNVLRADRKKNTSYLDEFARLEVKENGAYTLKNELCQPSVNQVSTKCPPSIVEYSIDKYSIDKYSIDKSNKAISKMETPTRTKPIKHKYGEYKNVLLTDDEVIKLNKKYGDSETKRQIDNLGLYIGTSGRVYKSHYMAVISFFKRDADKPKKQNDEYIKHNNYDSIDVFTDLEDLGVK